MMEKELYRVIREHLEASISYLMPQIIIAFGGTSQLDSKYFNQNTAVFSTELP